MRCAIVLLALVALGAAIPPQPKQRAADQELLRKQQDCINLLQQISQPIPNELHELGINYDIEGNYQQYENPIIVKYYVGAVKAGLVQPKGTVYSNSIGQLRKEVSLLYRILLGAQDYQTFLQTAAWARVHVNEGQFIKAFIGAVLTRPDTQGIILPPPYEIIPQHYFDARIIQEAQEVNQGIKTENVQTVVIPVNYTAHLPHGEHQLSYFTQDIGLATYYGYINLAGYMLHKHQQTPGVYQQQGVGHEQEQIGRGSRYYYLHQQLLARYQLNRLGNGLGPVPEVDVTNVKAPYVPHLRYINGREFPARPDVLPLVPVRKQLVHHVQTLLQRLQEAIDAGHVITPQGVFLGLYQPQGLNILGDLIEGTGRSINPRYYGSLQAAARQLLGNAPEVENIWEYTPSVLELGQTCVRDPVFYQLYKKIIHLFHHYQQSLPAYQQQDLILPGVTITGVEISKLVTFFDDHIVSLNGATVHHHGQPQIKGQLKRLDHKPYEFQINVQSERNIPGAVVRVYVGPKHDFQGRPVSINQHRHLFVELDQFIQDLQQGQNVIVRHSHQSPIQSHDCPSIEEIKQRVEGAIRSQEPFYITEPQQIFGFPARLSLPKGRPTGLPLQLLVVITGPGQQHNTYYGPVIPEQEQTYQHQHYQVVTGEEYQQLIQQGQGQQGQVQGQGIKPTIQVLPQQQHGVPQGIQNVVKTHSGGLLYNRHHGQYPITTQGHTEGQIYGIQGQYGQQYTQYGQQQQQYQGQQTQQYHGQQLQYQQDVLGGLGTQGVTGGLQGVQGGIGGIHGVHGIQGVQGVQGIQGVQGVQGVKIGGIHGVQGLQGGVQGLQGGVQGLQGGVQGLQGVQGIQGGVQGLQGVQGTQGGVQGIQGLHGIQGVQGIRGIQGIQGQNIWESGRTHGGGYQGLIQGLKQTTQVGDYFQGKHISEIIGGAISLDGRPLGFPLNRPLAPGALIVPNIFVHDVQVYHEGQTTNEIFQ